MSSVSAEDQMPAPPWLNNGDNAWQMTAASLVAMQSLVGLSAIYAGIVKKKWAVNSMFMVFYAFAMVLVCWCLWAYKMGFGYQWGSFPLVGNPGPIVALGWELKQSALPAADQVQAYPLSTMIYFQFVFAAITLVLIAGSVLGRMNFVAWMIFVPLWLTFSYVVGAFSIWGGGFLFQLGVLDYSGGYVIHLSSGTAGFVLAYWVGPRLKRDRDYFPPNNILLTIVGAGVLWIGWNGFNGGDPYTASPDAGVAVLNTNLCTAFSFLTWTALDYIYFKKPSIIGAIQGEITGLVAITPAAGFVAGWGAIVIGFLSGTIPWMSMNLLGRQKWFGRLFDDTLGVVHTHMVAGALGGFLTGLFATAEGTAAFASTTPGGAIAGNGKVVWVQIVSALFIIGYNIFMTSLICLFIKYVCRVPLRMSEEHLEVGDDAVHGELAYAIFYDGQHSHIPGDMGRSVTHDTETGLVGVPGALVGKEVTPTDDSNGNGDGDESKKQD